MKTQSEDTHPDVERVQIELLRKATVAQRIRLARSLTQTTIRLAWRAIEEANPGASQDEIAVKFVAVHYGQELADRLKHYLSQSN
jgi:hypothetical protein